MKSTREAFTLIELLIVIGIIGTLASIVIVAINPTKMLSKSKDAVRHHDVKQIENAMLQALIDSKAMPLFPATIQTAKDVCRQSVTGTSCTVTENGVDLAFLAPDYLASIPIDPEEATGRITGYRVYRIGSFYRACSPILDPTCGGPYPVAGSSSSSQSSSSSVPASSSSSAPGGPSSSSSMSSSSSAP